LAISEVGAGISARVGSDISSGSEVAIVSGEAYAGVTEICLM